MTKAIIENEVAPFEIVLDSDGKFVYDDSYNVSMRLVDLDFLKNRDVSSSDLESISRNSMLICGLDIAKYSFSCTNDEFYIHGDEIALIEFVTFFNEWIWGNDENFDNLLKSSRFAHSVSKNIHQSMIDSFSMILD